MKLLKYKLFLNLNVSTIHGFFFFFFFFFFKKKKKYLKKKKKKGKGGGGGGGGGGFLPSVHSVTATHFLQLFVKILHKLLLHIYS